MTELVMAHDRLKKLAQQVKNLKVSKETRKFSEESAQFMHNYLPMDLEDIQNALLLTFYRMESSYNMDIGHLVKTKEMKKLMLLKSLGLADILKETYSELLLGQDAIVDVCIHGFLDSKLGFCDWNV
jgi:hypothetical protein